MQSVLSQEERDYQIAIVLDPSDDKSLEIAKNYSSERCVVFVNKTRMYSGYNRLKAVRLLEPDDNDILIFLDADDFLFDSKVLSIIKYYYNQNLNLLLTHGSYQIYPDPNMPTNNGPYQKEEFVNGIRDMALGSWKASHLKTMKYKLFKKIKESSFKNNDGTGLGSWLGAATDMALMMPALEMAGYERIQYIPEILYYYNRETKLNHDKVDASLQERCAEYVVTKQKKYEPVKDFDKKTIDTLIFSKDRACQLDLLLRSIKDNFKELENINIIYKYSNDEFKKGYDKIIKKFNYINWIKENDFYIDVKKTIQDFNSEYFLGLVDDDVVIRKPDLNLILPKFTKDIVCVSLRLNKNINYCYSQNTNINLPEFVESKKFLKWRWTILPHYGDFGYPSCINSHIYKLDWFKNLLEDFSFTYPNELEVQLDKNRDHQKPYMISYLKTIVLNIPNNVSQKLKSRAGNNKIFTLDALNHAYINGYVINTNNLYEYNNISAHEEVPYNFIQE